MKKLFLCMSFIGIGLLSSCIDKDVEVDENKMPSWLGQSIYNELANPNPKNLSGTFSNYLRLIDDLDYTEVLSKTGSKTIFPANDEAFARFYADNAWGVNRYEDLTVAMKKALLYTSMLDNALLINMLSNVSSGSNSVRKGSALKHETTLSVTDSIPYFATPSKTFRNNSYWTRFDAQGIHLVSDNTKPMMVHFTRNQMTANDISVIGAQSDFAIITGSTFEEGSAYIFRDKIIHGDVTCQNGYIHQVEDVLIQPGNLAQVIREGDDTQLFNRMLDRFALPYYDGQTTRNYNDWAITNGEPAIDSIFQIRYLSSVSQGLRALSSDQKGNVFTSEYLLPFDPGWNHYYVNNIQFKNIDWSLTDIGAMFVPNDEALSSYFLPGGSGEFLIDRYGGKPNERQYLEENIDSIPQNIIQKFLANLMKTSFIATVPSKFDAITNDVSDEMGMTIDQLAMDNEGKYNVKIANNGVAYIMKSVIAPTEYEAVSAPAYFAEDMRVINWVIQNKSMNGTEATPYSIDLDFYAYLKAMTANYAVFMPSDEAFDAFYVDPATLGHKQPIALHFYYDPNSKAKLRCSKWAYNPETNEVTDSLSAVPDVSIATMAKQLADIMNFHTVVLAKGEKIGTNNYYKTKHGGAIHVEAVGEHEAGAEGSLVMSGGQIDAGLAPSIVKTVYNEKNGKAYKIDHVLQGPTQSVYKVLSSDERFSDFLALCEGFENEILLEWAGISPVVDKVTGVSPQDLFKVFVNKNGFDYNVRFFNTYNYTVYAPNNDAMQLAYVNGLADWEGLNKIYEEYALYGDDAQITKEKKLEVKNKIERMKRFVRYHFQANMVFADNVITPNQYQTLCSDDMGIYDMLDISGGNGILKVTDLEKETHEIDASDTSKRINVMTRDFELDATPANATNINTSSFAVIHEIDRPLVGSWK